MSTLVLNESALPVTQDTVLDTCAAGTTAAASQEKKKSGRVVSLAQQLKTKNRPTITTDKEGNTKTNDAKLSTCSRIKFLRNHITPSNIISAGSLSRLARSFAEDLYRVAYPDKAKKHDDKVEAAQEKAKANGQPLKNNKNMIRFKKGTIDALVNAVGTAMIDISESASHITKHTRGKKITGKQIETVFSIKEIPLYSDYCAELVAKRYKEYDQAKKNKHKNVGKKSSKKN